LEVVIPASIASRNTAACGRIIMAALWGLFLLCPPVNAQPDGYQFVAVPHFDAVYPPDRWVPVRLEFQNRTDRAVDSHALLPVSNDRGGVQFRLPVRIPAQSRVVVMSYAYFPQHVRVSETQQRTGHVPPVTIAQWRRADGGMLGRAEMLARPLVAGMSARTADFPTDTVGFYVITISGRTQLGDISATDPGELAYFIERLTQRPVAGPPREPRDLPRHSVAFDGCGAIIIDALHPDLIDQAQQEALLGYVTAGGTMIIANPEPDSDPTDSWLGPYLPVQLIGLRQTDYIRPLGPFEEGGDIALQGLLAVTEAVEAAGEVLLRDEHYVHVARIRLGLGQVVFISYPPNALDPSDPRAAQLWHQILNLDQPSRDWRETRLTDERDRILQSMIGLPAAPLTLAAAITGAYVLLILGVQLFVGGPRRPAAFVIVTALAVVLSIALVTTGMVHRRDFTLSGASMVIIDAAPEGGGIQQEVVAWSGANRDDFTIQAAHRQTSLRPVEASPGNPPVIDVDTFSVPSAGVHQARIERIWLAQGSLAREQRAQAVGTFGPQGLRLEVHNELGQPLAAPLILWEQNSVALDDLPQGSSQVLVTRPANPPGDFTNAAIFSPESAKLRADMIRASLAPPAEHMLIGPRRLPPMVVAWLDDRVPRLIATPDDPSAPLRTQAMVRIPLRFDPTPVGTPVRISNGFTRLETGDFRGLPYDAQSQEWIATPQGGNWVFGFAVPEQIGRLRINRAHFEVNVSAPQHNITIRRGQIRDGQPSHNPAGPVVVQWRQPLGRQAFSFECGPDDVDENGWVWIQLDVEAPSVATSPWHFREVAVSYEGEVVAPSGRQPQR
jgi:hypothetical protein